MKKILLVLLTFMCLFTLVACKNDTSSNQEEKVAEETLEVQEETTNEEEEKVYEKDEMPDFSIVVCGKTITKEEMDEYAVYTISVQTTNSEGTVKDYTYAGYSILDVLKAAGVETSEGVVVATATDGYEINYEENIIIEPTLIALIRNDETFKEGPWLAPCESTTNGDYLKNLNEIKIAVQ